MAVTPTVTGFVSGTFTDGNVKVREDLAVVVTATAVTTVSLTSPNAPRVIGSWPTPGLPLSTHGGLVLHGNYAIVSSEGPYYVLDLTDPYVPKLAGQVSATRPARGAVMVGNYYVAPTGTLDDLVVLNIADPTNPRVSAIHDLVNTTGLVSMGGSRFAAYTDMSAPYHIRVLDWPSLTAAPTTTGGLLDDTLFGSGIVGAVNLRDRYVVALVSRRVVVVDLVNPAAPVVVGSLYDEGLYDPSGITVVGDHALVSKPTAGTFAVIDLTVPSSPVLSASLSGTSNLTGAADVALLGTRQAVVPGANGLAVIDHGVNAAPFAPTLVSPTGTVVASTTPQRFTWVFTDADADDAQSAYQVRYRPVGTSAWVSTGWVTALWSWHTFPAGEFTDGDYEWQAATKDARGVAGPFSPSAYFTAATPPPGPTITAPANGAVISSSSSDVVWSVPDQDAYQLQVLDDATAVVFDTGQVNNTAARSRVVEFPTNDVTRTIQLRVLHEGLWSPWSKVTVTVSYTAPAVPSIALQSDDAAGSITVTPGIPAPATGEPAVVAFDTWVRRVGDLGDGTRIARDVPPSLDHTWWAPAFGAEYEFRIRVRGDNDTTTWSPWAGGPARYDESTYDAAAYA